MKKNKLAIILLCACLVFASCSNKTKLEPDISGIKNVAQLATVTTYYHSVAKGVKGKGAGLFNKLKKERKFWLEFDTSLDIGVNLNDIEMKADGEIINISLPRAYVLGNPKIDSNSIDDSSLITEDDNIFRNEITLEDQKKAVAEAIKEIAESAQNDTKLLDMAQIRAKALISNYINEIGNLTNKKYTINWTKVEKESEGKEVSE